LKAFLTIHTVTGLVLSEKGNYFHFMHPEMNVLQRAGPLMGAAMLNHMISQRGLFVNMSVYL